jgi:hypothetical protein
MVVSGPVPAISEVSGGQEIAAMKGCGSMMMKQANDIPRDMASCHTALIDGLVVEGHVPVEDILAYRDNPQLNSVGLSVPGMVQGSPGVETDNKEDYQVIAFNSSGQRSVFREHKDY